jgi:thioredoxin-related protein
MKWLCLLAAFVLSTGRAQDPPAWFADSLLDVREDVAEAAREGKRLMLYFGQDGCPYCKQLMEVNFRQPRIADKARRSLVALSINIWGDREVTWTDGSAMSEKRFAAHLKVQFTPTLLFFDERGGIALRINGYLPPHEFEAALDYVAGRMEGKAAFQEYVRANAGGPASERLHEQPFFLSPPHDLRRRSGGKPLAVLFETPHCAGCDELHRVAFKRQEVLGPLAGFDVVRLGLLDPSAIVTPAGERTQASSWAQRLKLGYMPAMVFFDRRGREVFRIEAYLRPFHLAGALEYVASGAYANEPSFQRFLQEKATRMRLRGETVDLWN